MALGGDRAVASGRGGGSELRLFRAEALAHQQAQSVGTVLLAPSFSHRLFVFFAVAACAATLALLYFASYTRTARVNGWLVPQEGVVRVFAPRPGIVADLKVGEGARVLKGQPLLTLSDEVQSAALGATQSQVTRALTQRQESLVDEQGQQRRLLAQQQSALAGRGAALDAEHAQIGREIDLLETRASIAARNEALHRQQLELGFISEQRLQAVQAEAIEQRARIAALERNRLVIARERQSVEAELKDLPLKFRKELGSVDRVIAQVQQERAEAEAKREIVVAAPQDGTVTSIQAVPGASADTSVPLLSVVPDSQLEAHLFSPSRAVGFVQPGQRVLLRHQAYPYQKFGQHEGTVTTVSRSAISPAELPRELAGLTSLTGTGAAAEPIYRITVRLARQAVEANGQAFPLKAGMLLEADVALDQRRLLEWVLEPLYTVAGRWRQ